MRLTRARSAARLDLELQEGGDARGVGDENGEGVGRYFQVDTSQDEGGRRGSALRWGEYRGSEGGVVPGVRCCCKVTSQESDHRVVRTLLRIALQDARFLPNRLPDEERLMDLFSIWHPSRRTGILPKPDRYRGVPALRYVRLTCRCNHSELSMPNGDDQT